MTLALRLGLCRLCRFFRPCLLLSLPLLFCRPVVFVRCFRCTIRPFSSRLVADFVFPLLIATCRVISCLVVSRFVSPSFTAPLVASGTVVFCARRRTIVAGAISICFVACRLISSGFAAVSAFGASFTRRHLRLAIRRSCRAGFHYVVSGKFARPARSRDLAARGLDFGVPRLYVLDGGKALAAAVRRHAGEAALIQRCQVHKRRNVIDHLPEEHKSAVRRKLQNAYAMSEYSDAKRALERLHRELMELNPSAARSLEEGMDETLTVHRLRVQLRRTLASTNVIESAFSMVETVCRNVKRWRAGDHIERWVGSGLLVAERQFRKVQGYREIPARLTALANIVSKKGVAEDVKVA